MVRKTKRVSKLTKHTKSVKSITVPELRRAFEHIQTFLHKGATTQAFRKEWKKVFGTELSEKAASDYIAFVEADKSKAQKGGAQMMSPSSLGYDMTNPGTASQAPSVPAYVAGGIAPPADSVYSTCGEVGKHPFLPPAASMGSNEVLASPGPSGQVQKGGRGKTTRKFRKNRKQGGGAMSLSTAVSEFMQRPFAMGSPPGAANDAMMLAKGYNSFPSPRPEINNPFVPQGPGVYNASISPVSRMF
jgi:hypothetical protein